MNEEKGSILTADDFLLSLAIQIAHQNNGVLKDVKIIRKTEQQENEQVVLAK